MCVFCKIINKEFSSKIVYEDEEILAILDLSQQTLGHTLVMPKKHYENILEIPASLYANISKKVQELCVLYKEKLGCQGFNIINNCNDVAGQTVMHFHVHIVPRYTDDNIKLIFTNDLSLKEINNEGKYDFDEILSKLK